MVGKQIVNHIGGAVRRYLSFGLASRAARGIQSLDPDVLAGDNAKLVPAEGEGQVQTKASVNTCPNCGSGLTGQFCAVCGQRDRDIRRPLWSFLADFNDEVLALDSRIVKTLAPLIFLPGALTRSFWDGRRARYVPPIRLYLMCSLFFFLVVVVADVAILKFSFPPETDSQVTQPAKTRAALEEAATNLKESGLEVPAQLKTQIAELEKQAAAQRLEAEQQTPDVTGEGEEPRGGSAGAIITVGGEKKANGHNLDVEMFVPLSGSKELSAPPDYLFADAIKEIEAEKTDADDAFEHKALDFALNVLNGLQRAAADPQRLNGALNDAIPWAMVFLLPVFALILRLFYWGRDNRLVKQLIFSLHFHSYIFLVLAFLIIAQSVWGGAASGWMFFAAVPLYLFLGLKTVSRQGWFRTSFKFVFISIFYMVVMSLTLTATVLVGLSEL